MSSEQKNNPRRDEPASSGKKVSDAKIVSPGSAVKATDAKAADTKAATPATADAKAAASGAADAKTAAAPKPPAATSSASSDSKSSAGSGTPGAFRPGASGTAFTASANAPASSSAPKASAGGSGIEGVATMSSAASGAAAAQPAPVVQYVHKRSWGWLLVLVLVLALAAVGWWYVQQRFLAEARENALRVQQAEARANQLEEQIRALRDGQSQIQQRGNVLEQKLAETDNQRDQLKALYDDVARVRGDARLAEVERALELASQHLGLAGNVRGALISLEGAAQRLGDAEEAKSIGLRRVILQDIERLKSLPEVDLTRSVARLDEVLSRIDRLPFLSDPLMPADADTEAGLAVEGGAQAAASDDAAAADAAPAEEPGFFKRFYQDLVAAGSRAADAVHQEFNSLVQIRRIDDPDRLLLAPDQKRSIREGLRLQLLNARISLLNRNEALFRADLDRAIETLNRYFDGDQPDVQSSVGILTELKSAPLQLNLPSLDSLSAMSASKAESEKGY